MSKYTTEMRYICETMAGLTESKGYNDIADIIQTARPYIFDFTYELYDNEHKAELETKIIEHFYTQEIGFETYGLWHMHFRRKFLEVLPYYNELYKTADLEYNPLYDVDYVKTHQGSDAEIGSITNRNTGEGSSTKNTTTGEDTDVTSTTTRTGTDWSFYSDTPQGAISRLDVEGNNYLTNVTKNTNSETENYTGNTDRDITSQETSSYEDEKNSNTSTSNEGTNQYTETMRGKVGTYSYAKLIKEYRDNILNIDLMFINEFEELFMYLW